MGYWKPITTPRTVHVFRPERLGGHHSPTVTMDVYAHQFKRRDVDDRASEAIEAALAEPTADNVVSITQATA
jgi:hypothetical protein